MTKTNPPPDTLLIDEEGDQQQNGRYAWEEKYKRSWELLQEDVHGSLGGVISQLQQQLLKKKR